MIVAGAVLVVAAFVAGCIAAPSVERQLARFGRWWRAPQVLLPGSLFRVRPKPPVRRHGPPIRGVQEGPPVHRCRAMDLRRGRCLHDRDHLGDHLFPVDLGLPLS